MHFAIDLNKVNKTFRNKISIQHDETSHFNSSPFLCFEINGFQSATMLMEKFSAVGMTFAMLIKNPIFHSFFREKSPITIQHRTKLIRIVFLGCTFL